LKTPTLLRLAICAGVFALAPAYAAEPYPTKPIRLITPAPPGGATDIMARSLAQKLTEALGQQVIVDNRGGGGTIIATQLTARAVPDGHTLLLANAAFGTNPALVKDLPYDTLRDFAPVTLVADSPLVFVAHPSLNVSSIKELIAAAKARPGQINYGSSTPGTGGHLSVEMLKWMAGIDLVHIPYKGAGPAIAALLAGEVPLMCTSPLPTLPHIKSGKLRVLAMTGRTRSRAMPEVPTVAESGLTGFQSSLWYALMAPAGTPAAVIQRINTETARIVRLPAVSEQLLAQGADPIGNSPQELAVFLRTDIERWKKVVREAGIGGH
jgi:tripartite-type tricarboxylate transporter receptor subunit TctC